MNGRHRQDGATLAEFVVVIPFALLFVLAIIQLGLMYSAKQIVNEGAFLAARAGSVQNADPQSMQDAMMKALIPLYQNSTESDDATRLKNALNNARNDRSCNGPCLNIDMLNPTPAAFTDFGVSSSASGGRTYIPNDNLEFRSHDVVGPSSGLSIQDANALKIKVTYGYELKVPLMKLVIASVMCAVVNTGIEAFQGDSPPYANPSGNDCVSFYKNGRVPIVSYATVQMQTPAFEN
jgi:hypothetical protein